MQDISVTLRVLSGVIPIERISELAGCEPDRAYLDGEPRHPIPGSRVQVGNFWAIGAQVNEECDFSELVLGVLSRAATELRNRVLGEDPEAVVDVWIGMFDVTDQGAFQISPQLSGELAIRGLELVFDLYVDHGADDMGSA